ncbi:hypothetical protein AGMMS49928_14660 [Spirochaetia bacterium]|nr:hypothetical protein AGMMS49928_14660 [Spirochaetia bacterium]
MAGNQRLYNQLSYKQKVFFLSVLVLVLALIYTASLIFDPERINSRSSVYAWIDPQFLSQVDRLEISRSGEEVKLIRKNDNWFVEKDGAEFPAKKPRVEDLLKILSAKSAYPVRASSASSHQRLGVNIEGASRILLRGGAGMPLLDLLIGQVSSAGDEVYLRKNNQNEVRSGEDRFSVYTDGAISSWYNLRLFPEDPDGRNPGPDDVQRLTIIVPGEAQSIPPALVLTRNRDGWVFTDAQNAEKSVDKSKVDSYIRAVLDAEGEDFYTAPAPPVFSGGNITLELGDGSRRIIRLGSISEQNRRIAAASEGAYVYELAAWTTERLFKDALYFEP